MMHSYVHYFIYEMRKLTEVLRLVEEVVPTYSVFSGCGYLHHGGYGWRGSRSQRYYIHFIPLCYNMKNAVVFAYRSSFTVVKKSWKIREIRAEQDEDESCGTNQNDISKNGRERTKFPT